MTRAAPPRALLFDVFGTVVDWRGSIIPEARRVGRAKAGNDVSDDPRCTINADDFIDLARQLGA